MQPEHFIISLEVRGSLWSGSVNNQARGASDVKFALPIHPLNSTPLSDTSTAQGGRKGHSCYFLFPDHYQETVETVNDFRYSTTLEGEMKSAVAAVDWGFCLSSSICLSHTNCYNYCYHLEMRVQFLQYSFWCAHIATPYYYVFGSTERNHTEEKMPRIMSKFKNWFISI